jgi:hypothetical protein
MPWDSPGQSRLSAAIVSISLSGEPISAKSVGYAKPCERSHRLPRPTRLSRPRVRGRAIQECATSFTTRVRPRMPAVLPRDTAAFLSGFRPRGNRRVTLPWWGASGWYSPCPPSLSPVSTSPSRSWLFASWCIRRNSRLTPQTVPRAVLKAVVRRSVLVRWRPRPSATREMLTTLSTDWYILVRIGPPASSEGTVTRHSGNWPHGERLGKA